MKNATRYCVLAPVYYRIPTDVYCSKQTGSSTKGKPSPIISSFLNWAEENCRCSQNFCGGAENVVKTETQQTFVNGLNGFITLGIYTPLEARVYCSLMYELPIDMGNSICTALLIYF